jgi:hypothetical protein
MHQTVTSSSQITSSLSVEGSIGSIVTGLLLARHNRTKQKEDPAGAASTSGKKHFTNYRYIALVAERSLIDKYPLLYP